MINPEQFWQFSLSFYDISEVKKTLLEFQNQVNGNVNLALLCAYLNKLELSISTRELEQLAEHIEVYSSQYTKKVRALRKGLQIQLPENVNKALIKQHLLAAELELEKGEQNILVDLINESTSLKANSTVNNLENYQQICISKNAPNNELEINNIAISDLNQYLN